MKTANLCQVERQSVPATDRMEAIALGVQARFEETTGYSKRVSDATVNVARALGIPESEINRWASQRLNRFARNTEMFQDIKSIMAKVCGTSLAQ